MADYWKKGSWNALCGVCGFKFKADQLQKRWDGVYVCSKDWEPRHILDFFKVTLDNQSVPWSQPDVNSTEGYQAITSASSPYTLDATLIESLSIDATSGNIAITLPAATYGYEGQKLTFSRTDTTTHTVTITRHGSDTINIGATSITVSGQNDLRLTTDGISHWTSF